MRGRVVALGYLERTRKKDLTSGIYVGQLTLDVNRYREARGKVLQNKEQADTIVKDAIAKHIANVQAAQARMQQAEIKFVSPATGGIASGGKDLHFLAIAAEAARENHKKLASVLRVQMSDISVFNVVALQTRGMLSMKLLDAIRHHVLMSGLGGPVMVVYPTIPKKVYSGVRTATLGSSSASSMMMETMEAASGAPDESSGDDDFDEEGHLPEVITRGATLLTAWQRAAALSKDHFVIDSKLGQHDLSKYYKIDIVISHKPDHGTRMSDKAMVLMPATGGERGPFPGSVLYKDGLYMEVDNDTSFIDVSKKASMQCKKDLALNWKSDLPVVPCRGRVGNKAARGQLGVEGYRAVLMDLMLHCDTGTMLVNDILGGVGELGAAATRVKVSPEAKENQKRVCYWGTEERRVFAEIAKGNIFTEVGEKFVDGTLDIPGLLPLPAPASANPSSASGDGLTSEAILAALGSPLSQLQIDANGTLLIPTIDELKANCPAELTDEILNHTETLRTEFPRPAVAQPVVAQPGVPAPGGGGGQPAPGGSGDGDGGGSGKPAPGGATAALPSGAVLNGRGDVMTLLAAAGGALLKETRRSSGLNLLLARINDSAEPFRVMLENVTGKQSKHEGGAFIGRGGRGTLVSSSQSHKMPEGRQLAHSWMFNRCNDFKRDTALRANGYWVLRSASGDTPKMQTLEDIGKHLGANMKDVWAHSLTRGSRSTRVAPVSETVLWVPGMTEPDDGTTFSEGNLMHWIPAREENTATGLECKGALRPAFEVSLEGSLLTPDNNPATSNCCCLFLKKTLTLKDKQIVVL